jgi:6-oxo-cyclohex-1-ene-carbonyl-CoA hydrolase
MEDAMFNCISCEMWSAYKMKLKSLVTKVVPVLRQGDEYLRNPSVITDTYVDDGEVVYGEMKSGADAKAARARIKELPVDFGLLDQAVEEMVWRFTNLFPGCLQKSIDGIRGKKKFFWDQTKLANRHWLAANMSGEAFLGFTAFNNRKLTGVDVIDFVKYRQLIAKGETLDETLFEKVLAKPKVEDES